MKTPFSRTPRSYRGKVALVTGGVSGFGLELVKLLAADGAQVIATDQHEQAPPGVLPAGVAYRKLDVRSDADWQAAADHVEQEYGHLDLLINNAGVASGGRIDVASMEDWQWIIDINLLGVVRGCRTFTPIMKRAKSGQIVNTASLAGLVHAPGMASYNACKAGVVAISETLLHELSPFGIEVNVICPSFFRTNLASSLRGADPEMEVSAVKLINEAPRSAQEVAATAYEQMQSGRFIILTDSDGRIAYNAKRYARPAYQSAMVGAAKRMADGKPGAPAFIERLQQRRKH